MRARRPSGSLRPLGCLSPRQLQQLQQQQPIADPHQQQHNASSQQLNHIMHLATSEESSSSQHQEPLLCRPHPELPMPQHQQFVLAGPSAGSGVGPQHSSQQVYSNTSSSETASAAAMVLGSSRLPVPGSSNSVLEELTAVLADHHAQPSDCIAAVAALAGAPVAPASQPDGLERECLIELYTGLQQLFKY